MATQITSPRGMRDFLPAEKRRRERVLATIRRVYAEQGFDEIETPVMEDSARLHAGLGGDNEKLSFAVMRRGLDAGDLQAAAEAGNPLALSDLGLRFDLTVPLARFTASHRGELPTVFRAIQIGPVWRAERPQKGRYRQFVQCDVDILGEAGPLAEAELLVAGSAALAELGLSDCAIRVNDRRLLTALLEWAGVAAADRASALISIDKLDKIGVDGVTAELAAVDEASAARLGDALTTWHRSLGDGIEVREDAILAALPAGLRERKEVREIARALDAIGRSVALGGGKLPLTFDPTLVRGMGYYTGTIFEVAHPASGSSVGGGGRYDGMIGRFLGQDVPACGFSIGFERIIDLIDDRHGHDGEAVVLLVDKRVDPATAIAAKAALAKPGRRVRIEKRPKHVRGLLERAVADGFTHVAQLSADWTSDSIAPTMEPLS